MMKAAKGKAGDGMKKDLVKVAMAAFLNSSCFNLHGSNMTT